MTPPSECPQTMPEIINDVEKRFDKNDTSFDWSQYNFKNEHMNIFVRILQQQNIWSDRDILNIVKASSLYYYERGMGFQ